MESSATTRAGGDVCPPRPRTRGIIAVSVVSLYRRAHAFEEAIRYAHSYLAQRDLPDFAQTPLKALLLEARREQQALAAGRASGNQTFDVFLRGSSVQTGLARLDTVLLKLQQLEKYILRIGAWVSKRPFTAQAPVPSEVLQFINPMITEPSVGSFQFQLRFEIPLQLHLPGFEAEPALTPDRVADAFFGILDAVKSQDAADLAERVPDPQYRTIFSRLIRNLVPDGKELTEIEIRRVRRGETISTVLRPELREAITKHLPSPPRDEPAATRAGVLRALHLDDGWIMLTEGEQHQRYSIVGGNVFDDVVGPFVNRRVRVDGYQKRGKFVVSDISPDTEIAATVLHG